GTAVERLAAQERRRLVGHADGHEHLALGGELADGMVAVVGAKEVVVTVDMDAVGAAEQAFAPRAQEVPVALEHDHRMLTAVEDVHAVLAVDGNGCDITKFPAVRQLGPVLDHAITMLATSEDYRHVGAPCQAVLVRPSSSPRSSPRSSESGSWCWRMAPR